MKNCQQAFTLLETILVVAILSIFLSVTLPNFNKSLAHYQLRSAAMQIAADMRWMRQQSIYGQAATLNFLLMKDDNQYLLREANRVMVRRQLPPGCKFGLILDQNPLTFTLTGAPGKGGTIIIRNAYGEQYSIHLMPSTGRIRVADGNGE